jgi:hypothetical protein
MNRELIDHIGSLLFGHEGSQKTLQLKSQKQFQVRHDGSLEKEQSVLTDIVVGKEAIYMTYKLPDGNTVCFVNAVTEVECEVDCNYTVGCIVYKTIPVENEQRSLFTLFCDDDRLIFFGEKENDTRETVEKTFFEISTVA